MRYALLLFCLSLAVACGGTPSTSDGQPDAPPSPGPFDLRLDLTSGEGSGLWWYVVVRDRADHSIVFWENVEVATPTFARTLEGKLEKGHTYDVGISRVYPYECTASSSVYYAELVDVQASVTLTRSIVRDEETDVRACDVLLVPVPLPAGTYTHTDALLGSGSGSVTLEVSESGRVYVKDYEVYCPESCTQSYLSGPTCDGAVQVLPDQQALDLYGTNQSGTTRLDGTATINAAANRFDYQGTLTVYTGSSFTTKCCEYEITAPLVRVGPPSSGCP